MPVVALTTNTHILSLPLIPDTVIVDAPVSAVPPELSKDQLAPPPEAACHLSPVASELSATNPRTISEDCAKGDYSRINTIVPRQRTIARTRINFYYGTNTARND